MGSAWRGKVAAKAFQESQHRTTKDRKRNVLADLKECSRTLNLERGKELHEEAVQSGLDSSIYVGTALISMYAKCGRMVDARKVFECINSPNVVSWTALILGYADNGEGHTALDMFTRMISEGCLPDSWTFAAAFKACTSLALKKEVTECKNRGSKIHELLSVDGCNSDTYVQSTLIDMYAKCGSMVDARQVFDCMNHQNVVSWTALIMGYVGNGEDIKALQMFTRMRSEGCSPNSRTYVAALKACTSLALKGVDEYRDWGKEIHGLASADGCHMNMYVQSSLIDMYAKYGKMVNARQVFDSMKHQDIVSWTSMIFGYADNGEGDTALEMFTRLRSQYLPDSRTFVAALRACISLAMKREGSGKVECKDQGKQIHDLASKAGCDSDIYLQSTLIDMYAKCGSMVDARQVFDCMNQRNVVSWTALILGYADNGEGITALEMYSRMRSQTCSPNSWTFVAVLKACALLGALEYGKHIHAEIDIGIDLDAILVTSLIDFYAKCGSVVEAQKVFDSHPRVLTTWNALLSGYSRLGDSKTVFQLFEMMQDSGIKPDGVTFTYILTCCSHGGLVEKGKEFFEVMFKKYGITPTGEHYTCMIDNYGRSNKLTDAVSLLQSMPGKPDAVAWMTVLGACRKWKNVDIGKLAFETLISYDDRNAAAYVLMGHIYGSRGMWEEQETVMGNRKLLKAWKKPGESCWTNEIGEVHTFSAGDKKHYQMLEIQEKLKVLALMMKQHGYVADLLSVTRNITDVEKEEALCGHSERLAIACAIINTQPGKTIRIVKNLRVCDDCHKATALISKLEKRTIFCRDANRFHVFEHGKCSCGDFW